MSGNDIYRARMNATGSSQKDAHSKATIDIVNKEFANSLGFSTVTVDGVVQDAVLQFGKTEDDRVILFRPQTTVLRGSIVLIGVDNWLITDTEPNNLYPKGTILKCNYLIKWGLNQSLAVVQAKVRAYGKEEDIVLDLPRGEYSMVLPFNGATKLIKEDTRFVIGGDAYSVIGLDNITHVLDGMGILTIHIKDDLNRNTDDLLNGIPDQKTSSGGWAKW